jgi:ABC-type glycerol-3-phosphate transport system permease component
MVLYPFFFAIITSLKTVDEYALNKLALPVVFYHGNYFRVLFTLNLLQYLTNTIITVAIGLVFYLLVCSTAGLAFGKFKFSGRLIIFSLVLFFMIFPQMVIAGELYQLLAKMKLLNTRTGIIMAWVSYFAPFGTYIMTTYFTGVPREIIESAKMDNANVFQLFALIMLPIAKPMLGTIGIIGTLSMWNELPFSMLMLQNDNIRTLTIGITLLKGEYGLPIPSLSAAVIISSAVPFVLYLFFQDFIAMNATAGSVKG